ncbi:MAG TPA: FAD binding domain-containing protein [Sphingomicrobium sp.]|nr:FAD binding domain-containing protein [Sphingomicrobium sp.]
MKAAPFHYLRAGSLSEALAALAEYGGDARVIAGGQSLGAMLNMRIVTPKLLVDINGLSELSTTDAAGGTVTTGALVRQADALADSRVSDQVPLLARALPHVGHYQTRNRGTLGGSVAHADPSAEIPLALATLGGEIELRSKRRGRRVMATQFFKSALTTLREPDELVTALHWPARKPGQRHAFIEFAVRGGDYAIVAVACAVVVKNERLSTLRFGFGGCSDAPQIVNINDLPNTPLDERTAESLGHKAARDIECRSDLLGSSAFRRRLAAVLAQKALQSAHKAGQGHA